MVLYYCGVLMLLQYHRAANGFAVLPACMPRNISMPTRSIASGSARSWLASGHPKLNRGRMIPQHPAAVLITANRARRWR